MNARQLPAEYVGLPDPGNEDTGRHAAALEPALWLRASVYRFGAAWHWKCGPKDCEGRCLGGPAKTQAEAYAKAERHMTDDHDLTFRVHDAAACWCGEES